MAYSTVGRYEIIAELGRGGMATVYHAHDPRFGRDVALKVLPRELLHDPTFRERFEREARTIAALEHSSIVPVHDFGEQDGQLYLVMRYMSGGSLAERIQRGPLALEEAIPIVERVAAGLNRAHLRDVIHRDVKPSNVLFDDMGDAFLTDFGIVKLAEATAQLTGSGIIGTPAYMAPEMTRRGGLTPLIDVYALGVMLFQMLTGELPYEADTPMGTALAHVTNPIPDILALRSDLPEGVQQVVAWALAKEPEQRVQSAPELAWALREAAAGEVVTPSLAEPAPAVPDADGTALFDWPLPEPDAAALASRVVREEQGPSFPDPHATRDVEELASAPTGGPVLSSVHHHPPRAKLPALLLAVMVLGGVALIVGIALLASNLLGRTSSPIVASSDARGIIETIAAPATAGPGPTPGDFLSTRFFVPPEFAGSIPPGAAARLGKGYVTTGALSADGQFAAVGTSIGVTLYRTDTLEEVWSSPTRLPVEAIAVSPDGSLIASGAADGAVIIWDAVAGQTLRTLVGRGLVHHVEFSRNAALLFAQAGDSVTAWETATGQRLYTVGGYDDPFGRIGMSISPDGTLLATAMLGGTIEIRDAGSGDLLDALPPRPVDAPPPYPEAAAVAFSPDSRWLLSWSGSQPPVLWEVSTGRRLELLEPEPDSAISTAAWSVDGAKIALVVYYLSGASDRKVVILDSLTGDQLSSFSRPYISNLVWSPDGQFLTLTSAWEGDVAIVDAATGTPIGSIDRACPGGDSHVQWAEDGRFLAVIGGDLAVWDRAREVRRSEEVCLLFPFVAFAGDGNPLVVFAFAKTSPSGALDAVLWNGSRLTALGILDELGPGLSALPTFSPTGTLLALAPDGGPVRVFNTSTGQQLSELGVETVGSGQLVFSPGEALLAAATRGYLTSIWDVATGEQRLTLEIPSHTAAAWNVAGTAFSPDGSHIASATSYGAVTVWDTTTGLEVHTFEEITDTMPQLSTVESTNTAFSHDGRLIAVSAGDGSVAMWDLHSGDNLFILRGKASLHVGREVDRVTTAQVGREADRITTTDWGSVAFSPDGRLLLTRFYVAAAIEYTTADGGNVTTVEGFSSAVFEVWDVSTGQSLYSLEEDAVSSDYGSLGSAAFSPDGVLLGIGLPDNTVIVVEAATGERLYTFEGHTVPASSLAFSPDGSLLASGSMDGTAIIWELGR